MLQKSRGFAAAWAMEFSKKVEKKCEGHIHILCLQRYVYPRTGGKGGITVRLEQFEEDGIHLRQSELGRLLQAASNARAVRCRYHQIEG
jgi:hypothetical protein